MAEEDLFTAFAAVPGTPTPGAQASASENDGAHAAVAQGTHHSKLFPVIDVCRRDSVEWENNLLAEPINVCFDDQCFF